MQFASPQISAVKEPAAGSASAKPARVVRTWVAARPAASRRPVASSARISRLPPAAGGCRAPRRPSSRRRPRPRRSGPGARSRREDAGLVGRGGQAEPGEDERERQVVRGGDRVPVQGQPVVHAADEHRVVGVHRVGVLVGVALGHEVGPARVVADVHEAVRVGPRGALVGAERDHVADLHVPDGDVPVEEDDVAGADRGLHRAREHDPGLVGADEAGARVGRQRRGRCEGGEGEAGQQESAAVEHGTSPGVARGRGPARGGVGVSAGGGRGRRSRPRCRPGGRCRPPRRSGRSGSGRGRRCPGPRGR